MNSLGILRAGGGGYGSHLGGGGEVISNVFTVLPFMSPTYPLLSIYFVLIESFKFEAIFVSIAFFFITSGGKSGTPGSEKGK